MEKSTENIIRIGTLELDMSDEADRKTYEKLRQASITTVVPRHEEIGLTGNIGIKDETPHVASKTPRHIPS